MSHERLEDRLARVLPEAATPPIGAQMVAFKIDWEKRELAMGFPAENGEGFVVIATPRDWYPIFELGLKMCRDIERGGGEPPR